MLRVQKKFLIQLRTLISNRSTNEKKIGVFREYSNHLDVVFGTWQALGEILPLLTDSVNDTFKTNVLNVLESVALPKSIKIVEKTNSKNKTYKSLENGSILSNSKNVENVKKSKNSYEPYQSKRLAEQIDLFTLENFEKYVNKVWNVIKEWSYTEKALLEKLMVVLIDVMLKHLQNKVQTTDLFLSSISYGGSLRLLGLQGFFSLCQFENLQYPDMFQILYSVTNSDIFESPYKNRFYTMVNLFLSSTYLPLNLVPPFAKKLARLALKAPFTDVKLICLIVSNLMIRHRQITLLMNSKETNSLDTDPFLEHESDPLKSNATQSSLWEIESLKAHIFPNISLATNFLFEKLPEFEHDLTIELNKTNAKILDNEINRQQKEPNVLEIKQKFEIL